MNLHNLLTLDDTLLDGVIYTPQEINKERLRAEIVLQCGLLTPVYPEPDLFKQLSDQFFMARSWEFKHLVNIIKAEYSPIENVFEERTEERTIDRALNRSGEEKADEITARTAEAGETTSGNSSSNESGSHRETENTESTSGTNGKEEKRVAAYDSTSYQPDEMRNTSGDASAEVDRTLNVTDSKNGSSTESGKRDLNEKEDITRVKNTEDSAKEDEKTTDTFRVNRHGNIGVTTNFDLIEGELALLGHFNLYKWIALQFRSALFIEVF